MVLQLNGPSKKPKLISFMRDTFVDIPGVGPNKINAAYAYGGAELVRETLKQNFNLDTKYYAKVDFQSFEKLLTLCFQKGVKIDAEKSLNLDGVDIEKKGNRSWMDMSYFNTLALGWMKKATLVGFVANNKLCQL